MEPGCDNRKCFTFLWILENFEYCEQIIGQSLSSPLFIVDTLERSKWRLSIYPRGEKSENQISLFLHRERDSKGPNRIEIDYELDLLESDGLLLRSGRQHKYAFQKGCGHGYPELEDREYVFFNQLMCLPQGALTMRCRMWKSIGEVNKEGQCIARTRIGVEKKAFMWKIPNFSTLDVGREVTFRLKSTSDDNPLVILKLFIRNDHNPHFIVIKLVRVNTSIVFSTFKSSLVDAQGGYVNCGQREIWFSNFNQTEKCTLSLTKDAVIDNECLYLPNDVLTLYCEQASSSGIVYEKVEGTSYGCTGSFISKNSIFENMEDSSTDESDLDIATDFKMDFNIKDSSEEKPDLNMSSDLKNDLSSMLRDNVLCDVKLCTDLETFPAHWIILSARSPVFRAMFKSDMKEKAKDRIDIGDLRSDTVRRMLLYMYTDSLEELQWEDASDLYVAAEKYQIMTLKDKCSSFMKNNLSFTNACEILLVADLHQDKELKSTVQDYILKNDKSIINSDEWKLLMEANLNLAAETMLLRFKE